MKRIDARAPVRLDLAGGWTDVPPYTHDMGGEVVNVAINIHAHASLEIDDDGKLSVNYRCDAPVGSGLGTTGAINVALMAAIHGSDNAEEVAYQFEALLGNTGGRQDQWAAKYGGFNHLMFIGDVVEEMPFDPPACSFLAKKAPHYNSKPHVKVNCTIQFAKMRIKMRT